MRAPDKFTMDDQEAIAWMIAMGGLKVIEEGTATGEDYRSVDGTASSEPDRSTPESDSQRS